MLSLLPMFNNSTITIKNIIIFVGVLLMLYSCEEDMTPLSFNEQTIQKKVNAIIDINYPKAEGNKDIAEKINETLANFLANEINMSETSDKDLTLDEAIKGFDDEYKSFKEDFSDTTQEWEALIESEVTYESEQLVCIAVNSYLDTGGAHGSSHVTFLNFDKTNGKLLKIKNILKDVEGFKTLVQPYFEKATKPLSDEETIEDPFYGEGFQLPESIGFGEKGVILLYNVYEIASYAQGVTEFSIPLEEAKPYLTVF